MIRSKEERDIIITSRESEILKILVSIPYRFFSREEILDGLKDEGDIDEKTINVYI
jgi:DNA-binding response OmpR family regulator